MTRTMPSTRAPEMSEAQFQTAFIDMAHMFRWRVAHFRPAKTSRGWRTAVQGDGVGFPDNVLVRGDRLIFAELKSDKGKTAPEQDDWLEALGAAGLEVYCWRPTDLERIAVVLK